MKSAIVGRVLLSIISTSFSFVILASTSLKLSEEDKVLGVHHQWLSMAFELTKNTVGFSAPVSARAYCYLGITMYESTLELSTELVSMNEQLNGYARQSWSGNEHMNWILVANAADKAVIDYLYRAYAPSQKQQVEELYNRILKCYGKGTKEHIRNHSIAYGLQIAQEIIDWSKTDGGDNGFAQNFPETYQPPACLGCWTKTVPGYLPALLPFWGNNRTMLTESHLMVSDCKPEPFAKDSSHMLFRNAHEIVEITRSKNPEFEAIAEYWNDATGYSGTPPGHFFALTSQLVRNQQLSLSRAMACYVKLGIALNEAFITCWELKYRYHTLRPISYIHQFIEKQYNSMIDSPPFPEFPSGHSFQSGAGCVILTETFGPSICFTDSTNLYRNDIVNTPRSFMNFDALAEEISISRLYGGIHFRYTLERSLLFGKKLGTYVNENIRCFK